MNQSDRRNPTTGVLIRWVGVVVGTFTIGGMIAGAALSYGRHMRADEEQDNHLRTHNEELKRLEDRVRDLEFANKWSHGDNGLLPNAPPDLRHR